MKILNRKLMLQIVQNHQDPVLFHWYLKKIKHMYCDIKFKLISNPF